MTVWYNFYYYILFIYIVRGRKTSSYTLACPMERRLSPMGTFRPMNRTVWSSKKKMVSSGKKSPSSGKTGLPSEKRKSCPVQFKCPPSERSCAWVFWATIGRSGALPLGSPGSLDPYPFPSKEYRCSFSLKI